MRSAFRSVRFPLLLLVLLCSLRAGAAEGLWLLPEMREGLRDTLKDRGMELDFDELYSVYGSSVEDAVCHLSNGGTGAVVSAQGLVLTNQHCILSNLQALSSQKKNYIEEGFCAAGRLQEIPLPGLSVRFTRVVRDVSRQILSFVGDATQEERDSLVRAAGQRLIDSAEKKSGWEAELVRLRAGSTWHLVEYQTFRDIRLVAVPPQRIAQFGGEGENWQWPRHAGDFALLRIYTDAERKPATYAESNVPYTPRWNLKVCIDGYKEGDFTMSLGYPGRTERYLTVAQLQQRMQLINPTVGRILGARGRVWKRHMEASPAVALKYAARYAQSENLRRKAVGENAAIRRMKTLEVKRKEERALASWLARQKGMGKYLDATDRIRRATLQRSPAIRRVLYYREGLANSLGFYRIASRFRGLQAALEREDSQAIDRITGLSGEAIEELYRDYDVATDREMASTMLKLLRQQLQGEDLPAFYALIDSDFGGDIDRFVDELFRESAFVSPDRLKKLLRRPKAKYLQQDLGMRLCLSTHAKMWEALQVLQGLLPQLEEGQRLYQAAWMAREGKVRMYPNANGTLRFSYGRVEGYSPDAVQNFGPATSLEEMVLREGEQLEGFEVDERLRGLCSRKDYFSYATSAGEMPLNFLTTNDVVGGNSGSPIFNARGEVIGLCFDANSEGLIGEVAYSPRVSRSINLDIRYVLFYLKKYAEAFWLFGEFRVVKDGHEEGVFYD
ncbi:MAG: hypothetical protein CSA97_00445 [Bacteroidetes bacterium]|nr:MAG: hypothetical protein CSA97_00445 [Bacteroidota bacterium]